MNSSIKHIFPNWREFNWNVKLKTMVVLAIFGLLQLSSTNVFSQSNEISLDLKNETIETLINSIESKTDYHFLYNKQLVDVNKKISVQSNKEEVDKLLTKVFAGTDIAFNISGKQIVLSNDVKTAPVETKKMITGIVVDEKDEPIIGASIKVKNSETGTVTNIDGKFWLEATENSVLTISYVGYIAVDVEVKNNKILKVVLKEDTKTLDELVVIGYGTVRKVDLTGSISVLDAKNFKDQPITQVSEAIQGRVAGVLVENSGVPGGSVKIRIRGASSVNRSNDPLYVVDGIVRETGLQGINSEDIQSMQILKDASSTAIYGSRGSNGVVLITTKKGVLNKKIISFDAQLGTSSVYKRYDILSPFEYATAYREIKNPTAFTAEEMTAYQNGTEGIDWQDEMFRTGITQNYKIAISNGTKDAQYYLSANYMEQNGIIDFSSNKRYQVRMNMSSDVTKWLAVTADFNASSNVANGADFNASKGNPLWIALNYSPTMKMMDKNGVYNKDLYNAIARNPRGIIALEGSEVMTNILNGMLELRVKILPELTFSTTNGIDYSDAKGYGFNSILVSTKSSMGNNNYYRLMLQSSNNLTYQKKWGSHTLTATGVYEVSTSESRNMVINGLNLRSETVGWWDANNATTITVANGYNKWSLMSGVGRAIYNFADKYFLTATLRADGSSKFTKKKWGYFPSVALAWNLGNENFMKSQNLLQDIKIKTSYGVVGNQAINPYETLELLTQTSYAFGLTNNYTGYWLNTLPTPNLTWEKTNQFDIGLDIFLLNNRLNILVDYFDKRTFDGLLRKQIPNYNGGGSYWVNAGEVSNRGVDLTITGYIVQTKNFNWNSTINATYLKNNVESLAGDEFLYGTSPAGGLVEEVTIVKPGYPIGSFYGYEWLGLNEKGDNIFADNNKNGSFDAGDRTIIGKSNPDYMIGWNNQINWKNWNLNMFFNGLFGAKKLNLVRFTMASMVGDSRFITLREAYMNNFDRNQSQTGTYPSLKSISANYQPASTQWLESADYIRLENISLSYNFTKKVSGFADLTLTLSCQNLLTITGYKGYDPANSAFSVASVDINNGIDMGAYPTPRTWTFGVKMNF